jgi:hypothetical protein
MGWDTVAEKAIDLFTFFFKKRKKRAGDAFVDYSEITAIIKRLVHEHPELAIERAIVLRAHNGLKGKRLMPGGWKFVSTLANDWRTPFEDIRNDYQELPIDNPYIEMLGGLYLRKELELISEQMTPGMLHDLYAKEGVKYARLFFLNHNEEECWFMSLATSNTDLGFREDKHRAAVYVAVNRIRKIVKPYFK